MTFYVVGNDRNGLLRYSEHSTLASAIKKARRIGPRANIGWGSIPPSTHRKSKEKK